MFHGHGSHPIGGAGPEQHGDWLVQAVPHLLHGGPRHGSPYSPLLSDVPGEHHRALLRPPLRLMGSVFFFMSTTTTMLETHGVHVVFDVEHKTRVSMEM